MGSNVLRANGTEVNESRKLLVERIVASRYISKSARLRDLLLYLSERVLDGSSEIHEQEIGCRVFGRPPDYDTNGDNIVRVHASMLRKRLEQYFGAEGANEPWILEIPRGSYAPVFHERPEFNLPEPPTESLKKPPRNWRILALGLTAAVFAASTGVLLIERSGSTGASGDQRDPAVRAFWSQIFRDQQKTDIVLDDATAALFQELAGRNLALSEYFDRSYLQTLPSSAEAAKLDEATAAAVIRHRYSSYANALFLLKVFQLAGPQAAHANVVFARDYSFHGLKTDNAVLLGNPRSNPWMEPFLPRTGLRWSFDKTAGTYYPIDSWAAPEAKTFHNTDAAEMREGYIAISLQANLGGNGNVLIASATGGSALTAAGAFLGDGPALLRLRKSLPAAKGNAFPYFEALIRVKGRSALPRDAEIVICRPLRD